MKITRLFVVLFIVLLGTPAWAQGLYKVSSPVLQADVTDATWHDKARGREVPVRIYVPQGEGKFPLIVFSHGLGGSGEMYQYFANHMAGLGYVVIVPTHHGSDTDALRAWSKEHGYGKKNDDGESWLQAGISDPDNLRNRPKDISFVIDQALNDPKLAGVIDQDRIGVAGHSFGAYTSLAVGGMTIDLADAKAISFRDTRVKAVLPMSPQGSGAMGISKQSWNGVAVPVLFLTGTNDYGTGGNAATWRREGYDNVKGVDDYLFTIEGATHMTFAGGTSGSASGSKDRTIRGKIREKIRDRVRAKSAEKSGGIDPDVDEHVEMAEAYAGAFFDAYLKQDAAALVWLKQYAGKKQDGCMAEFKAAK